MPFYKDHHPAKQKVVVCLGTSVEPVTPSRVVSFERGLLDCASLPVPSVRLSTCGPVMKAATCKLRHGALVCFMGHPTQDNDPPLYNMCKGFFDKEIVAKPCTPPTAIYADQETSGRLWSRLCSHPC